MNLKNTTFSMCCHTHITVLYVNVCCIHSAKQRRTSLMHWQPNPAKTHSVSFHVGTACPPFVLKSLHAAKHHFSVCLFFSLLFYLMVGCTRVHVIWLKSTFFMWIEDKLLLLEYSEISWNLLAMYLLGDTESHNSIPGIKTIRKTGILSKFKKNVHVHVKEERLGKSLYRFINLYKYRKNLTMHKVLE